MSLRFSKGGAILALSREGALELAHGDLFQRLGIGIVRPHGRGLYTRSHMDHSATQIGTTAGKLDQDLRS